METPLLDKVQKEIIEIVKANDLKELNVDYNSERLLVDINYNNKVTCE